MWGDQRLLHSCHPLGDAITCRRSDDMLYLESSASRPRRSTTHLEVTPMLMRTDPFRDLDRLAAQLLGTTTAGTWSRPNPMPLDACDVDIERNVLTVKAERRPTAIGEAKVEISERPLGVFSRQLFLGDTL